MQGAFFPSARPTILNFFCPVTKSLGSGARSRKRTAAGLAIDKMKLLWYTLGVGYNTFKGVIILKEKKIKYASYLTLAHPMADLGESPDFGLIIFEVVNIPDDLPDSHLLTRVNNTIIYPGSFDRRNFKVDFSELGAGKVLHGGKEN